MEHCAAALRSRAEARGFRAYVTDALMILTENTARLGGGRRLVSRWADAARPGGGLSGDEIAAGVIERAGLRLRDGEVDD